MNLTRAERDIMLLALDLYQQTLAEAAAVWDDTDPVLREADVNERVRYLTAKRQEIVNLASRVRSPKVDVAKGNVDRPKVLTKNKTELDALLSTEAVAEWLGLPVQTLYAQKYRGDKPGALAIKVGRHLRWPRRVLEAWLDEQVRR